ncbi:MAG: hypothetical protein FJZ01_22675 [Candidatus Sericytochromatia bacterium]|nr:hypothetical protein [Candidatus Tanganyikabacteria bacterium]
MRLSLLLLCALLVVGCAGQGQRVRQIDEESLRRPWNEPGKGLGLRVAVPPPVTRTTVPSVGPWAAEAFEIALEEMSAFRIKGPADLADILNTSPVGEAYLRYAENPDDAQIMVAAALAIGRAAYADFVVMESIDSLVRDATPGYNGFPALLATYRTHLVDVPAGRVVWSQGYSTRVEPRTDEAEPAIRWALLQTQRELVGRIPWRKDP